MRVKEWLKRRKATRHCSNKLRRSPWKPFTLSPPALGGLIAFTALLLAVVEASRQISKQRGGILFADDLDDLPASQTFAYRYLPTIIAIVYSIAWAWVDLDVKRMEPYYQLSRAEGAMASESLELSYPHDFLPFVPLKAARRRHWAVVYSSTVMLLLFWGITPFQNAVIGQTVLPQTQDMTYTRTSGLVSLQDQPKALSGEFFYTAYNIIWLKLQPPPLMTMTAAYDGARPEMSVHRINESWSFPSKEYSVTLECVPRVTQGNYTVLDGRECSEKLWYGWNALANTKTGGVDTFAGEEFLGKCTTGSGLTFALISVKQAHENGTSPTTTALFCNPKYVFYDANIITTPEGRILSSSRTSIAQDIPLAVFNYSFFEDVIEGRAEPHGSINTNFPVDTRPEPSDIESLRLSDLTLYGLALGPANYTEYLNQSVLQQTFEAAYKLLFISAFHSLNSHPAGIGGIKGTMISQQQAVTIVQSFAIMLETVLTLIMALGVLLLHYCWKRDTNLKSDPSSLTHTMSIISESTALLQAVAIQRDVDQMEYGLKNYYFKLCHWTRGAPYRLDRDRPLPEAVDQVAQGQHSSIQRITPATNGSMESSIGLGCLFCVFILVVLVILTYLWKHALDHQGLSTVSSNTVVFQLLFSYLPSATATFMDPIWTMLNRYLCTCQSLIELQQRPTAATKSLSLKYTSLPPALAFNKAFRSGHMVLALVCGMTLSVNLLAVAFSSLFNPDFRSVTVPSNFTQKYEPRLQAHMDMKESRYEYNAKWEPEAFYIAKSYLSDNDSLPPWVSPEFFFAPFELNVRDSSDAIQYRAETIGFQPVLSCQEVIPGDKFDLSFWIDLPKVSSLGDTEAANVPGLSGVHGVNISIPDQSGNLYRCTGNQDQLTPLLVYGNGTTTGEFLQSLLPINGSVSPEPSFLTCANTLVFSWFRANTNTNSDWYLQGESTSSIAAYNYTMLACRQRLNVHTMNVTVNAKGLVLDSDQPTAVTQASALPEIPERFDYLTPQGATVSHLRSGSIIDVPRNRFTFHNDGNARDWFSYLMEIHTNSSDFLNPHLPVPKALAMADRVNKTYQMLIAIALGRRYATDNLCPLRPDNSTSIPGTITYRTKRVSVSTPMFIISAVVLSINLIVAIAYCVYTCRNKLPWAPYSLMDTTAYFTNTDNDALVDVQRTATMSTRQRDAFLREKGSLYGLGKVVDERGRERWVIDRAEKIFRGDSGR